MHPSFGPFTPVDVSADIGNLTTTVISEGKSTFFPSFTASIGKTTYGGNSKITTDHHHLTVDGINVVIGVGAIGSYGMDTLLAEYKPENAWRRYVDPMAKYCFFAGLAASFLTTDTLGVRLATGAPLGIYQNATDAIKKFYMGEHKFVYNGHTRTVVVSDVFVYGEGNEALRLVPPRERAGKIVVHDIGGRTWNVIMFKDGERLGHKTYDMGIDKVFGFPAMSPLVPGDPGARWAMQQDMRKNPKAHMAVRKQLTEILVQGLGRIERKLPIASADKHILIGGGAFDLLAPIEAQYKKEGIVLNGTAPEGVNAIAYALALRAS